MVDIMIMADCHAQGADIVTVFVVGRVRYSACHDIVKFRVGVAVDSNIVPVLRL